MSIVIETTLGDLTVDLYYNRCPLTCYNFMKLCKAKYYNMVLFHSIIKDFVAQTGDPTGVGDGGTSIFGLMEGKQKRWYKDVRLQHGLRHCRPGLLSMVHCGDNMFGSQFVITLGTDMQSLDGEHIIFGEVSDGHDVLLRLNETLTDSSNRPYKDVKITHIVLIEDPFEDPDMVMPPSPAINEEELTSSRIAAHEKADSEDDLPENERQERLKEKEAKAQATILEIVGDLPSYDVSPPENVLFVCRLNPVTTEEDLEIIFSRFGKIMGAEVIKDRKTGDSLQYAFIEFEDKKSCENAYMKMEGVLVDERRIHVDFSQSVARRIKWNGKGQGVTLSAEEDMREKEKRRGWKSSPGRDSAGCSSWDVPRETDSRDKAKRDEQESKKDKCRMDSRKDDKKEEEQQDSQRKKVPQEPSKCREEPIDKSSNKRSLGGKHNEKQKHLIHDIARTERDISQQKTNIQQGSASSAVKKYTGSYHFGCSLHPDPELEKIKERYAYLKGSRPEFAELDPYISENGKKYFLQREQPPKRQDSDKQKEIGKYASDRSQKEMKNVSQSEQPKRQDSDKREKEIRKYTSDRSEKGSSEKMMKNAFQSKEPKRQDSDKCEKEIGKYTSDRNEKEVEYASQSKQPKRQVSDKHEKEIGKYTSDRNEKAVEYASQSKQPKRQDSDKHDKEIGKYTSDRSEKEGGSAHASGTTGYSKDGSSLHKGEKVLYASQLEQSKDSKDKNPIKSKKMKVDDSEKECVNKKAQRKKKHPSESTSSDSSDIETPKGKTAKNKRKPRKVMKLLK